MDTEKILTKTKSAAAGALAMLSLRPVYASSNLLTTIEKIMAGNGTEIEVTPYYKYAYGLADINDTYSMFAGAVLYVIQNVGWIVLVVGICQFILSLANERPDMQYSAINLCIWGMVLASLENLLKLASIIF